MNRIRYNILLTYFLLLQLSCLQGQPFPNFKFGYITMKGALSDEYVTEIVQGKNGFIWLGTSNGLNRYDRHRIKLFFHKPENSNSLISNQICINTAAGLCCYDQALGRFIHFTYNPSNKNSLQVTLANYLFINPDKKNMDFNLQRILLSEERAYFTERNSTCLECREYPT